MISPDEDRSARRSASRRRIHRALRKHGPTYAHKLAQVAHVDESRLRDIIYGKRPAYRPELSPAHLGTIEELQGEHGPLFALTSPRGERFADALGDHD